MNKYKSRIRMYTLKFSSQLFVTEDVNEINSIMYSLNMLLLAAKEKDSSKASLLINKAITGV